MAGLGWVLLLGKRPPGPVWNELILPVAILESALHDVQDTIGAATNVEMARTRSVLVW
jgi:hypothetical protein